MPRSDSKEDQQEVYGCILLSVFYGTINGRHTGNILYNEVGMDVAGSACLFMELRQRL